MARKTAAEKAAEEAAAAEQSSQEAQEAAEQANEEQAEGTADGAAPDAVEAPDQETQETNVNEASKAAAENVSSDEDGGPSYKLASGQGVYRDPASGWTVVNDQAKPLPGNVSPETLERIKVGYLVKA